MSQAYRIKQIIENLTQKQKMLFEFILIQFLKNYLLVKTSFYLFQCLHFSHSSILEFGRGMAYNQRVATGTGPAFSRLPAPKGAPRYAY